MAKRQQTRTRIRKTDVRVTLTPSDLVEVQSIYTAITAMRGGVVDGESFTENLYVYVLSDQRYPVHSDRQGGIIGWFRWDIDVSDNLMFYPNRYIEVVVQDEV